MEFVLVGFTQVDAIRQFCFSTVGQVGGRQEVTIGVDLGLIRRYGIPLQELPLLCKRLLESRGKIEPTVFAEGDMQQYASEQSARAKAVEERRSHHRPVSSRAGNAWRGSPPTQDKG